MLAELQGDREGYWGSTTKFDGMWARLAHHLLLWGKQYYHR
jgi:hypothetical protein